MLKMVDGTGIIGVDMICPLGISTPQPPNYDRVEMEGAGMLVLPNSLDAPLERLELGGKTEQVQTSGKNLFDPNNNYEDLVWIRNDGEIVGGSNARTSDYIPVEQGNYAFQFDVINYNQMFVAGYNTGKQFVKIVGIISKGKCIIKIDDIQIETIRLSYTRESTRIQLERSETQTPYEPYTGGKPSPSPEYPQEIKNSGKWNEGTQKYEVDVKVTGKNLFDREKAKDTSNWIIIDGDGYMKFPIYVKKGNKITFSYTEKPTTGKKFYLGIAHSERGSVITWLYHDVTSSLINNKYTTVATNDYVYLMCNKNAIQNFLDTIQTLQVEISQTQTNYQPYKEQLLTLTSDRPLTKWDRLVEQGGQIGWLYGTEKYVVTGQEEFSTNKSYALEESVDFSFINSNQAGIRNAIDNFCNKLTFVDAVWSKHDIGFGLSGSEVHIRLPLDTIGATKTDESEIIKNKFTEYLSKKYSDGEPFAFWHKSKTQEFVPLPQSEQNAIRALTTYYPTTVISIDGGEVDPDIKVTYRKEI